jgi:FkbM family methyltransferase
MLRRLLRAQEILFPALFSHTQYAWHVTFKRGLIYPDVTRPLFKIIGSEDKIAIDVGANYGIATRYFAKYFRQTHAIEPVPFLARRLAQMKATGVIVHDCAIGDTEGQIRLRTPVDSHGRLYHALSTASKRNALTMFHHSGIVEFDVTQRRLDSLLESVSEVIGYIKIDVEGFELEVLRGAQNLIARDRPLLQVELERTHNPDTLEVVAYMASLNYNVFSITPQGLRNNAIAALFTQAESNGLSEDEIVKHQYDFLFIPAEAQEKFAVLID